jgi:FMN phosphatase YigB (HAD superfamily)
LVFPLEAVGDCPTASFFEVQMSLYSIWARQRYEEEHRKLAQDQEKHNQMKLEEWLEEKSNKEPTIFVDQDNTLLLLANMESMARRGKWVNDNSAFANIMGYHVGILPRPHALKFLAECNKIGTVYVLTAGDSSFQKQVLKTVGMLDSVKGVFGRDTYHEVPKASRSVLIDNLAHSHPNSVEKLQAMGGGAFLKVPDWEGLDPKDTYLMEILPKLKKIFA